jgi:hypothetical protein
LSEGGVDTAARLADLGPSAQAGYPVKQRLPSWFAAVPAEIRFGSDLDPFCAEKTA